MKKISALIGVSALVFGATTAQAQSLYGDVAYQMFDTDLTTDPAVVRGIIGYQIIPNLAVEGMAGLSVREGKDSSFSYPASAKVDRLMGVYAKSSLKLSDAFELYGRLGVVSYKVSATVSSGLYSASAADSGSGISYGIGASYYLTPAMSINVDYMDFNNLESGAAVGLKLSF